MEALRIILHQTSANYRKEEANDNKMTYPLPPLSTVIGALHKACGYRSYHPMDVSIQGKYESMHLEPYTDYCFLNSLMDDRGILVKMKNSTGLSKAFTRVAAAKKSQGNSFRDGITIQVFNEQLIEEYRSLKRISQKIDELKKGEWKEKSDQLKNRTKEYTNRKKQYDKGSEEYKQLETAERNAKEEEKNFLQYMKEYEETNYKRPMSYFRSVTTSVKHYEVLDGIQLILHVKSDQATLEDMKEHIYEMTALGRSEDFIDIQNAEIVTLQEKDSDDEIKSPYSAYISCETARNGLIFTRSNNVSRDIMGTKYYLNKNYVIDKDKRKFEKKRVIYTSEYSIAITGENVYIDDSMGEPLIVNFL